jgi:hypothetical protein
MKGNRNPAHGFLNPATKNNFQAIKKKLTNEKQI